MRLVNVPIAGNQINLNFKIDKIQINKAFLDSTEFNLNFVNNVLKINALKANFNNAKYKRGFRFFFKK